MGRRSSTSTLALDGLPYVKKWFDNTRDGRLAFEAEALAARLFVGSPWKVPVRVTGDRQIVMPQLPDGRALASIAPTLTQSERETLARAIISAVFAIFFEGYAHRDLHAGNIYVMNGQILLHDFETLGRFPSPRSVEFSKSYDLTGAGLPSPWNTRNMHWDKPTPLSIGSVLGVTAETALELLKEELKGQLRIASATFATTRSSSRRRGRHLCKSNRIYASFSLPQFSVTRTETQRHSAKRLERFGVSKEEVEGRTVLDLGCNTGAMAFEAQRFGPSLTVGIEYDANKVQMARRVTAYCGLATVDFRQADVDQLSARDVGVFDAVFCLALEAHVRYPQKLYALLGQVTRRTLFFEGNDGCDLVSVEASLSLAGFTSIERRGVCDDDVIPENNTRPLLVARKST